MAETMGKGTYSKDEVAAAIANVLGPDWNDVILREHVIRELLLFLPDPPEPEAATEAARMIVLMGKDSGQS